MTDACHKYFPTIAKLSLLIKWLRDVFSHRFVLLETVLKPHILHHYRRNERINFLGQTYKQFKQTLTTASCYKPNTAVVKIAVRRQRKHINHGRNRVSTWQKITLNYVIATNAKQNHSGIKACQFKLKHGKIYHKAARSSIVRVVSRINTIDWQLGLYLVAWWDFCQYPTLTNWTSPCMQN